MFDYLLSFALLSVLVFRGAEFLDARPQQQRDATATASVGGNSSPHPEEARQRRLEGWPRALKLTAAGLFSVPGRPSSFDKLRTRAGRAPQDETEIISSRDDVSSDSI
jgi:hypothetical protein